MPEELSLSRHCPVPCRSRRAAPPAAAAAIIIFVLSAPLSALDVSLAGVEDDSALRRSIQAAWFQETPARVLAARPFLHTLPGGGRVEVRAVDQGAEFSVVLAREYNASGDFPGWVQGSFVFTRNRSSGEPVRVRIFPRSDPAVWVQIRPAEGGKSLMDVVIHDACIIQSRRIPLEFGRILQIPVEETFRSAGAAFPRRYFEPDPGRYRDIRALLAAVRPKLASLSFRDDGAIDENGRYVFIGDRSPQPGRGGLNCSGFAKWFVDGILRPLTGERLEIDSLKAPFGRRGSAFTDPWEAIRDPYFGLDWTRNLAAQANSVLRSPGFATLEEIEVRSAPVSAVITRNSRGAATGLRSWPGFLQDAGFGLDGLEALLYTLAIDEPGRVYLASVNQEMDPAPRMRQHFHVAVLVPYFDEYGRFAVALFESAEETGFARFKTRYTPGTRVNLVRIPAEAAFDP